MVTAIAGTAEATDVRERCVTRMEELCCWWAQVGASQECPSELLRERLFDLRSVLAPSARTNELRLLLADLDQLIMRLGSCRPGQSCWTDLSHGIGLFLSRMRSSFEAGPAK